MNIFLIIGLIILWLIPGIVSSGFAFAFFQGRFKNIAEETYASDRRRALFFAILGPINLIAYFIAGLIAREKFFSYGWRLK